jgi:hypothetical protein
MKVYLVTQTLSHGTATRVVGKGKPVISFRRSRSAETKGGTSGSDSYIMTTVHEFNAGQIVKYGDKFFKVSGMLTGMAYINQYRLEVMQ